VLGSTELLPDVSAREYAESQGVLLGQQFPGYRELGFERRDFGPRPEEAYVRRYRWDGTLGIGAVTQAQLYYVECGRAYVFTATARERDFRRFRPVFEEVFDALPAAD